MAKLNLFYYVDPHIHIICYNIHWTSLEGGDGGGQRGGVEEGVRGGGILQMDMI